MAAKPPPPARAAADPPAAPGQDDRAEQALARSRELRKKGRLLIQEARERAAAARRPGPGAGPWPAAQPPAARLTGAGGQIERSRQARAHLAEVAAKLAQAQQALARIHDEMADRDPGRAAQYRRAAGDARQAVRDIQHNAGSGPR